MPSLALIVAGAYLAVFMFALVWNLVLGVVAGISAAMRIRQLPNELPVSEPTIVVTLVHGTWARRTSWIFLDSPLCRTLRRAADAPVLFQRFTWSGRNSTSARRGAVDALAAHLHRLIAQWPNARHYVVGHSHGGNVAFQALADPVLNGRIEGLVCLSTPFLTVTDRELGPVGQSVLWWVPVVLVFYGGVFVLQMLSLSGVDALGVGLLVLAVASGFLTSRLLKRLATSVLESLKYPVLDPSKVLILRAAGDEASAAIGATHILSWVTGQLWLITSRTLGGTVDTLERWRETLTGHRLATGLVVGCLVSVCVLGLVRWSATGDQAWLSMVVQAGSPLLLVIATLVRGGLAAALIGRFLFAVIAAPFLMLIAVLGVSLGPELLAAGLLLQVTAETTPPGRWVVWQVGPNANGTDEGLSTGLMHSATYQDARALAILEAWFAAAVRGHEAPAAARTRGPGA